MDAEMALWYRGAGRAPSPQLSKKGSHPCPRGDKGTAQQGREISRSLHLREHIPDVKQPSMRGAQGSRSPCLPGLRVTLAGACGIIWRGEGVAQRKAPHTGRA